MKETELAALYAERWEQVRHLNDLDRRTLVLAVTALTGAAIGAEQASFGPAVQLSAALLAAIICAGALYSTAHNRESLIQALHAIQIIEGSLRANNQRLFPWATAFRAPGTFKEFSFGLLLSVRGPLLAFFASALAVILAFTLFRSGLTASLGRLGSAGIASLAALFVLHLSLWKSWIQASKRCKAINNGSTASGLLPGQKHEASSPQAG